jgi:hypothetical protein
MLEDVGLMPTYPPEIRILPDLSTPNRDYLDVRQFLSNEKLDGDTVQHLHRDARSLGRRHRCLKSAESRLAADLRELPEMRSREQFDIGQSVKGSFRGVTRFDGTFGGIAISLCVSAGPCRVFSGQS